LQLTDFKVLPQQVEQHLLSLQDPLRADVSQRFFKTAMGEYGYGDKFLGISMPKLRAAVKQYQAVNLATILGLLKSSWHEFRMFALLLMVHHYQKGDENTRQLVFELYLQHTEWINNWDLVDCSAYLIVGPHLQNQNKDILYTLAQSSSLWERRIAILATLHFVRQKQFEPTLVLAHVLLNDKHDLIQKAVGWMLREVGKREPTVLLAFLQTHYQNMPRTMLRYAIEKLPEKQRHAFLLGLVRPKIANK
jgi:3-methyladenine DNA glycosylase AlkD